MKHWCRIRPRNILSPEVETWILKPSLLAEDCLCYKFRFFCNEIVSFCRVRNYKRHIKGKHGIPFYEGRLLHQPLPDGEHKILFDDYKVSPGLSILSWMGRINVRTERFESSFYPNCLKVYGIYDPKGVAILTQLRVVLSKLNSRNFNHNFRDTFDPMCPINDGIEDTEHFLLQCHAYENRKHDLLSMVNEVFQLHNISNLPNRTLVEIMLYGDRRFTHDQNRQILESTLKFIHFSERFL